jgi:hypothetical protein
MPEFIPEPRLIESPLGRYTLSADIRDDYLNITRTLTHFPVRLTPDQYSGICRFYEDIRKADGTRIVFVSRV